MDTLYTRSDLRLTLSEHAAIASAYGRRAIDLLSEKSIAQAYSPRARIEPPDEAHTFGILVAGWVFTEQQLTNTRIILEILLPYDPIVIAGRGPRDVDKAWIACTPCRIFWVNLQDMFALANKDNEFRINAFSKISHLRCYLDARLRVATHFGAMARLALFILQTLERLKDSNPNIYDRFLCPLSQSELGALLGMTNIHVSRSLSRMEANGEIRRHKSFIEIVDAGALSKHLV